MRDGVATSGPHLAQGMDFTFAREGRGPTGLSGMIEQSQQAAQLYGMGQYATPSGWELGNDGQFVPTYGSNAPTTGLGSIFSPKPAQQSSQSPQWSNNWLKLASWLTPGEQVPGGPASQWWTGWLKGGW